MESWHASLLATVEPEMTNAAPMKGRHLEGESWLQGVREVVI